MSISVDVAIIDTGICISHPAFQGLRIDGMCFQYDDENIVREYSEYNDKIGHGTAVAGLILEGQENASVFICKVTNQDNFIPEDILLSALSYLDEHVECPIINMSIGYTRIQHHKELYEKMKRMEEKGVVFISAFDNLGAISYPAAYDCVIGVDVSKQCRRPHEIIYVGGETVTVCAKGSMLRAPSVNGSYIVVKGTSFATALVTRQVLLFYHQTRVCIWCLKSVKDYLRQNSIEILPVQIPPKVQGCQLDIKKAVVFPYGKEAHNLALYAEQLSFVITGFYDHRLMGKVGKRIEKEFSQDYKSHYIIQNIDDINWDNFDTLILCHIDKLIGQFELERYIENLIQLSLQMGKKIFSFDNIMSYLPEALRTSHPDIYWPEINKVFLPRYQFGMLHCLSTPVLGIMGTSSKQGKFAIQMRLRQELMKIGYRIAQLGTEPYSELFGFDAVYPMGHNSTVALSGYESIYMLNDMLHKMELMEPDIIITGSQSGTLPYSHVNLQSMTQSTIEFLFGTEPDAVILCVNPYDSLDYVKRTISFIQSAVDARVIAVCLFPFTVRSERFVSIDVKRKMSCDEIKQAVYLLGSQLKLPVYNIFGDDIYNLCQCIIDFF